MSEDTDLARLFTEQPEPSNGDAFAAAVATRIAHRRRILMAAPIVLIALLLVAVWATWPAAKIFATASLGSVDQLAHGVSGFFTSDIGVALAAAVTLSLASWAFATRNLRAFFR